jgi:hypothetical protein
MAIAVGALLFVIILLKILALRSKGKSRRKYERIMRIISPVNIMKAFAEED